MAFSENKPSGIQSILQKYTLFIDHKLSFSRCNFLKKLREVDNKNNPSVSPELAECCKNVSKIAKECL